MDPLLNLGARALSARIASGAVSPVEVMRACLDRIADVNGRVNAIVALRDREALMGEARLAEVMLRGGAPAGWLHGVPVAIKDLVLVRGVRSTSGSPIHAERVPVEDEGLARRLRAAGAIVIGKTNVPDFGVGSHTVNAVYGATRNPYDPARSAGGSSGGAGVALAARMLWVADGSDAMGSLRNPAAWANVYGFRPTAGLVPGAPGDSVVQHRLSTDGPMARDPGDLAQLLETLSDGAFRAGTGRAPARPRIGWLGDWGGALPLEPGLGARAEAALATMRELGWQVAELAPPFPFADLWQAWVVLRQFTNAMTHGALWRDSSTRALLPPQLRFEIARGLARGVAEVERAADTRLRWRAAAAGLFGDLDALVLPATQTWPFPVESRWPERIGDTEMDTYHRWMSVMIPASLAGLPALALPAGFGPQGLPAGVQMLAAPGADATLLALGQVYHDATLWPQTAPPAL